MVQLMPEGWGMREYFAECERQIAEERRRHEQSKVTLLIEETWQLAMFGEPDELVRDVIVGHEIEP